MIVRRRIMSVADGKRNDGGKDPNTGRFTTGNKFGRGGSPYMREQYRIQAAIRAQLDDDALREFVKDWIKHAREGKSMYLVSLLERLCGKAADHSTEERIQQMEEEIEQMIAARTVEIMDGTKQPNTQAI